VKTQSLLTTSHAMKSCACGGVKTVSKCCRNEDSHRRVAVDDERGKIRWEVFCLSNGESDVAERGSGVGSGGAVVRSARTWLSE
jgi:hypothetical protein